MAYNSRQKKQPKLAVSNDNNDDDYVYPTKKVGQQTRNRRSDRKLIKAGLVEHENPEEIIHDEDWYDDQPMTQTAEDITNQADYEDKALNDIDEAHAFDSLHDDLMEDCGYDWEDY